MDWERSGMAVLRCNKQPSKGYGVMSKVGVVRQFR
ncbi:hypothetical protein BH24PSE2_BH24PSE2_19590 [soil metagenome]